MEMVLVIQKFKFYAKIWPVSPIEILPFLASIVLYDCQFDPRSGKITKKILYFIFITCYERHAGRQTGKPDSKTDIQTHRLRGLVREKTPPLGKKGEKQLNRKRQI